MEKLPELKEVDYIELGTILPDKYLVEIGRIVADFAILENELFSLVQGLLGTNDDITRIVTSELPFRNLLDLSASLVKQIHSANDVEMYKGVLKLVANAEEERNRIVHSLWKAGFFFGVIRTKHTAKRARGLQVQNEKYMVEDLQDIARRIVRARHAVKTFREGLGYPDV